jgi:hypothetical protein
MIATNRRPRVASSALAIALAIAAGVASAGVINPDISVIGQPFMSLTDDPTAADRKRLQPDIGETEVVFDAALNPYARGSFTMAFGEEGFELEEGYFALTRFLPAGFALRGGQYRAGFGRLNPMHPHMLPFAERFGVLAAYLPGEEAFIDVGASLSRRVAIGGETSVQLSADWLGGDSFRIARGSTGDPSDPLEQGGDDGTGESRPGFLARAAMFTPLGDPSGLELGVSATGGTNNVAASAQTRVYGADAKAKLWTGARSYILVQAEALHLERDDAGFDPVTAAYANTTVSPTGGYIYADYNWATRYNAGASYEGFQRPTPGEEWDESIGLFAGLSLLEETTAFRADWRRVMPDGGPAFNTYVLRVIFSMGPHKAHQF